MMTVTLYCVIYINILCSIRLDDIASLCINGKIDDVMERLMAKLELQIPRFLLKRRVQISQWIASGSTTPIRNVHTSSGAAGASATTGSESSKLIVQVSGIEADGTPMSLFREVRMHLNVLARSTSEPHRFTMRIPSDDISSIPTSLTVVMVPYGHYRESDVTLSIPVQPNSIRTWILEYDPHRQLGSGKVDSDSDASDRQGCWIRQELVHTQTGTDVANLLAAASGLPIAHFLNAIPANNSSSTAAAATAISSSISEEKDQLADMIQKEQSEGVTAAAGKIHAAAKHPPSRVAREVMYTKGVHKAVLTKCVPADSAASGHSLSAVANSTCDADTLHAIDMIPPRAVLITCGGAGGGPGHLGAAGPSSVYETLATRLPKMHNIAVMQVVYSKAGSVPTAVTEVRAAIDYCLSRHWGPIILMGWSMGAAVIAQAGEPYASQLMDAALPMGGTSKVPVIRALIFLAGQSAGVDALTRYSNQTAFLMLHGDADDCLPTRCADGIYSRIPRNATKQIVILPNNHHGVQDAFPILDTYIPKLIPQIQSTPTK
jgi:dienelactone hydrolase